MYLEKFLLPVIFLPAVFLTGNPTGTPENQGQVCGKADISKDGPQDTVRALGKKVFYATCSTCHRDSLGYLAPGQAILSAMTPRAILAALDNGKMRQQAAALSERERKAVAVWLTNSEIKTSVIPASDYTIFSYDAHAPSRYNYSGWGGNLAATGFRTGGQSRISVSNIGSLKLKWVFAFPDATIVRSKPAIVGNWLIVGSQFGDLFAINRKTGKPGWHFSGNAAIRGAIVIQQNKNSAIAFFADYSTTAYAIDLKTGKTLWSHRAALDPQSSTTGSVAVYGGKVFVPISSVEVASAVNGEYNCCFSSGGVVALDEKTGAEIWRYRVISEKAKETGKKKNGKYFYGPSGAPVWCSPTIDAKRGLLYIGTGENYTYPTTNTSDAIQALNIKTGRLVWNFQATRDDAFNSACPIFVNCPPKPGPDLDFGMAPLLVKRKDGKDILVAGQKSGVVYALSPDEGKMIWQRRIGKGGMLGGIHWGMASDGNNVYATNADNALTIDRRDSSQIANPGVFAMDLFSGKVIWTSPAPACDKQNCLPFNSAAPAVIPGIVFAGSLDGHIRGYATKDGKILWDFDTAKNFGTVNGIPAKGGSLDGPAPVFADGMLYVNSGYNMFGEMAGNVILAFGVDVTH